MVEGLVFGLKAAPAGKTARKPCPVKPVTVTLPTMPIASDGMPLVPVKGPQVVVEFAARAPVAPPVPLRVSMMRAGWKKLLEPSAASTRMVLSRLHPAVPAPEARDAQRMLFTSRTSSPPAKLGGWAGVNSGG